MNWLLIVRIWARALHIVCVCGYCVLSFAAHSFHFRCWFRCWCLWWGWSLWQLGLRVWFRGIPRWVVRLVAWLSFYLCFWEAWGFRYYFMILSTWVLEILLYSYFLGACVRIFWYYYGTFTFDIYMWWSTRMSGFWKRKTFDKYFCKVYILLLN